jgi:hypothetical protein
LNFLFYTRNYGIKLHIPLLIFHLKIHLRHEA